MFYYIKGDEICGYGDSDVAIPGYTAAVSDLELAPHLLYWDGDTVRERPPQPSSAHYWDTPAREWVEIENAGTPPPPPTSQQEKWATLANALEGSPLLNKGYAAAEIFSKAGMQANLYITVLLTIVSNTHNLERLIGAIAKLRAAMTQIAGVGDFTAAELAEFREILANAGFDLTPNMMAVLS